MFPSLEAYELFVYGLVNEFPSIKSSPDIKHNRIIAPGLSFEKLNLPLLVREIEQHLFE